MNQILWDFHQAIYRVNPQAIALALCGMFVVAIVYAWRRRSIESKMRTNLMGSSALGIAGSALVAFEIARYQSNVAGQYKLALDAVQPHFSDAGLIIGFVLVYLAIVVSLGVIGSCLELDNTKLQYITAIAGGVTLITTALTGAASGLALYLTNDSSALRVIAIRVWLYSRDIALLTGSLFVILTIAVIIQHQRIKRLQKAVEVAEQARADKDLAARYGAAKNNELYGNQP